LEQFNDSSTLDTKRFNGSEERMGLSFYWGTFGIKKMIEEKIISTSFSGDASHGERAPVTSAARARTISASTARPFHGADQASHGAWAALPLRGVDPSATWCWGGSRTRGGH